MSGQGSGLWYMAFPVVMLLIAYARYKKPKTGIIVTCILLFFSMFRGDGVGKDTLSYMDENGIAYSTTLYYEGFGSESVFDVLGNQTEIASNFLNYLVHDYNLPTRVIIYAYSIITILFFFFGLKRLKIDISWGMAFYVLLGLYFFSLSAARQMAAVSIFVYGLTYLFNEDKKNYLFFAYTILATTIHASAIFFIWLYFLKLFKKIDRTWLLAIMTLFSLITIFMSFDITDIIYSVFDMDYIQRYKGRFDESDRSILGRINDLVAYGFLLYLFSIRKNKKGDLYDCFFAVAVVLMALFGHSSGLIARVTYYTTIFICFYAPKVILERNCLKQQDFMIFFLFYVLLKTYNNRMWTEALTSGYYLMF